MHLRLFETLVGAFILVTVMGFVLFSLESLQGTQHTILKYDARADFNNVGTLKEGDDVKIKGVKVGFVRSITLNPSTYMIDVKISIYNNFNLPIDSKISVKSLSIMGGVYVDIVPGTDSKMLSDGGVIKKVEDFKSLESLINGFVAEALKS